MQFTHWYWTVRKNPFNVRERRKTYTDSLDWLGGCLCGRGSDDRHPLLQHLRSHLADILCHRLFAKVWHSLIRPWVIKFLVFFPKEFSVFCIEGTMSLMVVFTQDFSLIADQSADFQYFVMKTPSFFIRSHRRNISLKILISGFEWRQISRVCVTSGPEIKLKELCTIPNENIFQVGWGRSKF